MKAKATLEERIRKEEMEIEQLRDFLKLVKENKQLKTWLQDYLNILNQRLWNKKQRLREAKFNEEKKSGEKQS